MPRFVRPLRRWAIPGGHPPPCLPLLCLLALVLVHAYGAPTSHAQGISFLRGDTNDDGGHNLADAIFTLETLFIGGTPTPHCLDALDSDDSGVLDLADAIWVLTYLFVAGDPPLAPFAECGIDPTPDGLDCIGPVLSCPPPIAPRGEFAFADPVVVETTGVFLVPQPPPADETEFAGRRLGMRPLTVTLDPAVVIGTVVIDSSDPALTLHQPDGSPVPLPITLDLPLLPANFLVNMAEAGRATLSLTSTGSGETREIAVISGPFDGLAGTPTVTAPFFRLGRAIPSTAPEVRAFIDPENFTDRVGESFHLYVLPHRTPAEWALDSSLSDVTGGFETGIVGGGLFPIWSAPLDGGPLVSKGYDLVLDFGLDGFLDPGDVIDGLAGEPSFSVVNPLNAPGPYPVQSVDYSGGGFLVQRAYYPTNLATLPPRPLVMISHGNGHMYTWYDYLGEHLASYGYVVVSHMNNTFPGIHSASTTTLTNTNFFVSEIDTIENGLFDGEVDVERIAWIGHSRGGEGVVRAYTRLADGGYPTAAYSVDDIRVVSSIAPTVFLGVEESDPRTVPYHVIAGSSDSDVTGGVDCQICQYFRLAQRGRGPVQVTYIQGSSHNDFNCCGFQDGIGPDRIGRPATQTLANGYLLALVETYLEENPATIEYLQRSPTLFPLDPAAPPTIISAQYEPAELSDRFIIDDFQETPSLINASSSGWAVEWSFGVLSEEILRDFDMFLTHSATDNRNGMTQAGNNAIETEAGLYLEWPETETHYYQWLVPEGARDWRSFADLSLRGCQITRHPNTVLLADTLGFTITLIDGLGNEASIRTADHAPLTSPYLRGDLGIGFGWSNEFSTIRVALSELRAGSALDLGDVRTLRLDFGTGFGSPLGRIALDDVLLLR